jgi:hypothetical protein
MIDLNVIRLKGGSGGVYVHTQIGERQPRVSCILGGGLIVGNHVNTGCWTVIALFCRPLRLEKCHQIRDEAQGIFPKVHLYRYITVSPFIQTHHNYPILPIHYILPYTFLNIFYHLLYHFLDFYYTIQQSPPSCK